LSAICTTSLMFPLRRKISWPSSFSAKCKNLPPTQLTLRSCDLAWWIILVIALHVSLLHAESKSNPGSGHLWVGTRSEPGMKPEVLAERTQLWLIFLQIEGNSTYTVSISASLFSSRCEG
jgi:hypothetical protein